MAEAVDQLHRTRRVEDSDHRKPPSSWIFTGTDYVSHGFYDYEGKKCEVTVQHLRINDGSHIYFTFRCPGKGKIFMAVVPERLHNVHAAPFMALPDRVLDIGI